MAVPLAKAYVAWTDEKVRSRCLPDAKMEITSATSGKYVRAKWDGDSRVAVGFFSRGPEKTQVAVDHGKLPNSRECAKMKVFWFEALSRLERALKP